jgi:tetratricopeptide (TPR) repeat protein
MIMTRRSKLLVFMLLILPVVWSCAQLKGGTSPAEVPAPPAKATSQTSITPSARTSGMAKKHLDAGDYQKAIAFYEGARKNHPHDRALLNEYTKSIEVIKTAADEAFNREDFVSACGSYDVLLKKYQDFDDLNMKLSFDGTRLDENFSSCKNMLSKQGFEEYRKGNLSQAIVLWQALLAIDPDNAVIQKALDTARLQQKNLPE